MADKVEKILDIKVNYSDAVKKIAEYKAALEEAKGKQKELKQQLADGETTQEDYTEAVLQAKLAQKEYSTAINDVVRTMKNQKTQEEAEEGSLKSLRAELANLTKTYDSLGEAQRESTEGTELKDRINTVTEVLKVNEESTGRYFRNVGNYENSIIDAFNKLKPELDDAKNKYTELLQAEGAQSEKTKEAKENMEKLKNTIGQLDNVQKDLNGSVLSFVSGGNAMIGKVIELTTSTGGLSRAFTVGKSAVAAFSKQLLALLMNPVVAILAGIAAAIMAISKAINSSEELTNRWRTALAPLNGILDVLTNILTSIVSNILYVVEAGGKLLTWLADVASEVPVVGAAFEEFNEKMREQIEIEKMRQEIVKAGRELTVLQAKNELEIAKLRAEANDKENNTAQERKKALQEALKLEEETAAERKRLAELKFEQLKREAALTENNAEMNEKLAAAEAEVYKAQVGLFNLRKSINKQMLSLSIEIANEEKQASEKSVKAAEDRARKIADAKKKELDEIRKTEDELLKLVTNNQEKIRIQTERQYERQIEDLKNRLETEKDLTIKAREAINDRIIALEQQKNDALSQLNVDALNERISQQQKLIETQLAAATKGSEEELEKKRQLLALQRDAELMEENLTEEMKLAISEKWAAQDEELYKKYEENRSKLREEEFTKKMEEMQLQHEMELEQFSGNELEKLELELNQKQEELDALQQMEGESIDAFNLRKIKKENEYISKKKELADKEISINRAKASAIASTFGTISDAMNELSETNKKALIASKILAIAEVAIQQGVAIANVIKTASGSSATVWDMIAAIAAGISAVVSSMTSAIKSIKGAKVDGGGESGGKGYATGGRVTGEGTGTSDSIPARLSNGESVITARATDMFSPILSAFNMMGGGVPITATETSNQAMGEEMLARAVAKGVQAMPAPVVSVEEINNVDKRVKVLETLETI